MLFMSIYLRLAQIYQNIVVLQILLMSATNHRCNHIVHPLAGHTIQRCMAIPSNKMESNYRTDLWKNAVASGSNQEKDDIIKT